MERVKMKPLEAAAVAFAMCVALFSIYFGTKVMTMEPGARRPLCGVAEISPDFTPEERKNCREMRRRSL
jgi:hypothetical protein